MTCDRILTLIEEYYDGELERTDREQVDAHLAGCAACAASLEALEHEQALFARYDRGFAPSPKMWDAVLARIEPDGPQRASQGTRAREWLARAMALLTPSRLIPIAVAACAVVVTTAIALTILRPSSTPQIASGEAPPVTWTRTDPDKTGPGEAPPPANPGVRQPGTNHMTPKPVVKQKQDQPPSPLPLPVIKAEKSYLDAIAVLSKDVERTRGGVDPKLQKPLDDIDHNILAARKAVEKNPSDTEAVLNMLSAYDQKVEVLQTLARYQEARNR
jgi:hypothetical protein